MSTSREETNKSIVLEAFETLFNKRDYRNALNFWSASYIQHSAHVPPGRDGLIELVKNVPTTMRYENQVTVAEGDFVLLHGRFFRTGRRRTQLGRCGYCPHGERDPHRALGCHSRRSRAWAVQERQSDVRE